MKGRIKSADNETSIKKNSSNSCFPRTNRKRKSLLISCLMLGIAAQMPTVFASELSNANNNNANDNDSNHQNTKDVVSLDVTDSNIDTDAHNDIIKGDSPSAIHATGTPAKGTPSGTPIVPYPPGSRSKTNTNAKSAIS